MLLLIVTTFLFIGETPTIFLTEEEKQERIYIAAARAYEAPEWFTKSNGDVFINNSQAYILSQDNTNHPMIEIMSKNYTGNVNVVFGFNTEEVTPTRLRANPRLENVTHSYTCDYNISYTLNPKYLTCYRTIGYYNDDTGILEDENVTMFEHAFDSGNLSSKTIYWNQVETVWTDIGGSFTKIKKDLQGYDTWYYKKNVPITAGTLYTLKLDMQLQSIRTPRSKYWIGIYPSHLSFEQAVVQDKLQALDPWTDSLTQNLDFFYAFDESTGTTIPDSVENFTGEAYFNTSNANWVTGVINNGFHLDGPNQFINTTFAPAFTLTDNFSISLWFKSTDLGGGVNAFGTQACPPGTDDLRLQHNGADGAAWRLRILDTTTSNYNLATNISRGEYVHIVFVRDRPSDQLRIYVDGVSVQNHTDTSTGTINLGGCALFIGSVNSGANISVEGVDADYDLFGIWSKPLTVENVLDLWNGGAGITFPTSVDNPPQFVGELPINSSNLTSSLLRFNATVFDDINLVNVSLILDDSIVQTNTTGLNNSIYIFTEAGLTNGQHNWSLLAWDNFTQSNQTITRNFNISISAPIVVLNSPVDEFNTTNPALTFNGTVTANVESIANVSLFINDVINQTNSSGLAGNYIFSLTLGDGTTKWEYLACDTDNDCTNSEERNVNVDTTNPVVNITLPLSIQDYHLIFTNETINWTITETNPDVCLLEFLGFNNTVTCTANTFEVNLTQRGSYNATLYANDTFGNSGLDFHSWEYKIFELNQTFNNASIEGSLEDFRANVVVGGGITILSAQLNYPGNVQAGSVVADGLNTSIFIENFVVPGVTGQTNVTFNWSLTLSDATVVILETFNQTVSDLGLDDCSVFSNQILNFTVVDERTQVILPNATIEIDVDIFTSTRSSNLINLSQEFDSVNPVTICLEEAIPVGVSFSLDTVVKYNSQNHSVEYYNIVDATLDSTFQQNITLFDLLLTENTDFLVTFKDSSFVVVEGALVSVNRQFISEGQFKTVELPLTDSNGQTVVHLVESDVVYNFVVTKDGVIIGTFNNLRAFCDDATIGSCFISLNAQEGNLLAYDYDTAIGVASSFSYNETGRVLTFAFVTTDSLVKTINLVVNKSDQIGNTSVCDDTIISSAGTFTCNVPASIGNATIFALVTVNGEGTITRFFNAGTEVLLGIPGLFLLLFMLLSFTMMFSESKAMTVIAVILGFGSASLLYFNNGGILTTNISGAAPAFIWLVISGGILLWKLNKEGQT